MLANLSAVGNQAGGSSLKMYRLKKHYTLTNFPYEYDITINFIVTDTLSNISDLKDYIINKGGRSINGSSSQGYEIRIIQCLSDYFDGDFTFTGTFLSVSRSGNGTNWGEWSDITLRYDGNSTFNLDNTWIVEEVQ